MSSRDLTRDGLIRALSAAVPRSAGVDAALGRRAGAIATRAEGQGLDALVLGRGAGRYAVEISGPGLFSRAFGALDAPPDGTIPEIIDGEAR